MSKVPIKVLLDETMTPFMPFITTSAVQLQDGEHSLEDLETAVANSIITGSYDSLNKKIILTAQNGHTVEFSIADIIYGLQNEITQNNKLSSDLVDDSNYTNKFVSASDKTTWNEKQDALVSGTNIKTINNQSILGSGNISISGGGGGSVDIDGSSITKNSDDEIQTVGIIDNNSGNTNKIWTGTLQQYNAIQNKDANTLYYITDDDATSTLRSKVEVITSSDTSYTIANLTANKSYKLGTLTALTITACETFDEESVIYFGSGTTATVLSLPNDVVTIGDEVEANKAYIMSILNKIAVIKSYEGE